MGFRRSAVNLVLKGLINFLCKVDSREFVEALRNNEPLLVITNHINFLEVLILATHSYPVYVSGLAKSETWKNPIFAFIFNTYKAVPINRTGSFSEAFKRVRESIDNGFFMCITPEGTRSKNGILQKGKAGIVHLALDAKVPILPVAHYGGERIWKNIRRLKKTDFHFRTGRPFRINYEGRPSHDEREKILSEVMGQIACLLPEQMRGIYAAQTNNECKYLEFI